MKTKNLPILPLVALLLAGLPGCKLGGNSKTSTTDEGQGIDSQAELRSRLRDFGDLFTQTIQGAALTIMEQAEDPAIRKRAVIWKMRLSSMVQSSLFLEPPMASFIDLWVLSEQTLRHVADDKFQDDFGDLQPLAVRAAERLVQDIESLGKSFLNDEQIKQLQGDISKFVDENPIHSRLTLAGGRPSLTDRTGAGMLKWLTDIRLPSFRPVPGLDESAQAIREFAQVADQFTQVVRRMPEDAAWQLQWLLLELDDLESIQKVLASVDEISKSANQLTETAEKLPAEVEKTLANTLAEAEKVLASTLAEAEKAVSNSLTDLDSKQGNLQGTVKEVRALVDEVNVALKQADQTISEANGAATSVTQAGNAWTEMARAFGISDDPSEESAPEGAAGDRSAGEGGATAGADDEGAGFDINEYKAAADSITEAAVQIQTVLADAKGLTEDDAIDQRTAEIIGSAEDLTDHIFWRAVQLVGVLLVGLFAFKFVSARFLRPS